ncbi:MAG: guanylate kinase [Acidobacteriota bacterium]
MSSKGGLIVISAPSGSGKTSLARRVLEEVPQLKFSVSHTTRKQRKGEQDGVEYYFVSKAEFEKMIEQDAFLEYAHVYGNCYATSRAFVESELSCGNDVLLEIDVQGALKVKRLVPEATMVFVFPPSFEILKERLEGRGLDDEAIIGRRLRIARNEIEYYRHYQYVIVNENIERSVEDLKSIILAKRCGLSRRTFQAEQILQTFKD